MRGTKLLTSTPSTHPLATLVDSSLRSHLLLRLHRATTQFTRKEQDHIRCTPVSYSLLLLVFLYTLTPLRVY
jgi:hypothetical protein